jgi:hypothetical protein
MKVYQAINKVQAALAVDGIGKDRSNQQQGYKFRGIDDVTTPWRRCWQSTGCAFCRE